MKKLWLLGGDWDDTIPDDLADWWIDYYSSLATLRDVKISRWVGVGQSAISHQLHGFSDASNDAYAAVVYIRVEHDSGDVSTHLIASKTRVAPSKRLTTPRLELSGAVLLAQLIKHLRSLSEFSQMTTYCWTDASIVLAWLSRQSSHWNTFVGNRVATIHTYLDGIPWRHVPGTQNPADLASRGMRAAEMATSSFWWRGPEWLRQNDTEWPSDVPPVPDEYPLEVRAVTLTNIVSKEVQMLERDSALNTALRFSNWPRLLRVTAYILRWSPRYRSSATVLTPSADELSRAELRWIYKLQSVQFPSEIAMLTGNELSSDRFRHLKGSQVLPKGSLLRRLNPILDEKGLLRVGGRLGRSSLPTDAKFPYILRTHHIARLLVREAHRKCLHGGITLTLSVLRNKYWILQARKLVKSEVHNCLICARIRADLPSQLMGSLPPTRIERPEHSFAITGVDYAGPLLLRMGSGRGMRARKAYVAVFICLATKAVHLEVVSDYSAAAFLAAFDRFSERRGPVQHMYSDCGTTFQGADRELREAYAQATRDEDFQARLAEDRIVWHFIPPAAPHFGGLWEVGVKAMKHHLRRVLGESTPTFEELTTLLCRIEGCMNSRPLAPIGDDPESLDTLTPAHLLRGYAGKAVPRPPVTDLDVNRLSRWQRYQQMLEIFWQRWSDDYVKSCQHRTKWERRRDTLRIGQMVLLRNENLPPTKWHLGRIMCCHPGPDGLVRVVTVKTANSTFKRPITTKLALLPISIEDAPVATQEDNTLG